jgi:hypothetical protein
VRRDVGAVRLVAEGAVGGLVDDEELRGLRFDRQHGVLAGDGTDAVGDDD